MKDLQSIYQRLTSLKTQGLGLNNGLMGQAIFTYELFQETKKEEFRQSADSMIDRIVEEVENASLTTLAELSEIGWGLSYLIRQGFLEDDTNALKELDSLFKDILLDKKADRETVISIGLYFCARSSSGLSSAQTKRCLLLCQQIVANGFAEKAMLEPQLLLNYFSFLAGLFHLNIFRFRTMHLLLGALSALQGIEKSLSKVEFQLYGFIVSSLMEEKCIHSFIQEKAPSLYEFVMGIIQKYTIAGETVSAYPVLYERESKIYLIPDNWHCIPLFSPGYAEQEDFP